MSIAELVALGVDELRRDVPVSDVTGHRARQDALRQAMFQLAERLGVDDAVGGEPSGGVVRVDPAWITHPSMPPLLPRESWRPAERQNRPGQPANSPPRR